MERGWSTGSAQFCLLFLALVFRWASMVRFFAKHPCRPSQMWQQVTFLFFFSELFFVRAKHTSFHLNGFLATLVALHFTPVSEWVDGWAIVMDYRSFELVYFSEICKKSKSTVFIHYEILNSGGIYFVKFTWKFLLNASIASEVSYQSLYTATTLSHDGVYQRPQTLFLKGKPAGFEDKIQIWNTVQIAWPSVWDILFDYNSSPW